MAAFNSARFKSIQQDYKFTNITIFKSPDWEHRINYRTFDKNNTAK